MSLEDHVGDVIRKTRMGLGVTSEAVAAAGQISLERLAQFEEHGTPADGIAFREIAQLLQLDGQKILDLVAGWEPAKHDETQWRHLRKIETDDGGMAVNCYLIWDQNTGAAALFDTGWVLKPIQTFLDQHQLELHHIFITHSHYDHIEALGAVRQHSPAAQLHSRVKGAPAAQQLQADEEFSVGKLRVRFRETPGHAEDGITYIVDQFPSSMPPVAIVGDAIFAGSIGGARAHFDLARNKIKEQIFTLAPETLICPGHGPVTTVGEEQDHNPFFL